MDAALALLVAILQVDIRFRSSSPMVPSIALAETVALGVAGWALLAGLVSRWPTVRTLLAGLGAAPAGTTYWVSVVFVAIGGIALGISETLHSLKDQFAAGVLFLLCLLVPATPIRLQRMEAVVGLVGLLVVGLALAQALFGGPYLVTVNEHAYFKQVWDTSGLIGNPVVGPFAHPNSLALFLVPVGLLAWGRAVEELRGRSGRLILTLHLMVVAGSALAVFLSGAKMGLGALVIGLGIGAIAYVFRIRCTGARALVTLVLFSLLLAITVSIGVGIAATMGLDYRAGSLVDRWLLNVLSVEYLRERPLLLVMGGGAEAFVDWSPQKLQVHNEFLLQVMRFGLVPGILFVAMIGQALVRMEGGAWPYALSVCGLVIMLMVEPAGGAQAQGTVMTILGLCALRFRTFERRGRT